MDWATFFQALQPGINNALSIYSNNQQQKTQNEKAMLSELASDKYDPEVRKLAVDGLMDPGNGTKYLTKIKDLMAGVVAAVPAAPPAGPSAAAGDSVTGVAGPIMAGPPAGGAPAGPGEPPTAPVGQAGPAISMRGSMAQPAGSPTQGAAMTVPQLPAPPPVGKPAGAGAGAAPPAAPTAPPAPGPTAPQPTTGGGARPPAQGLMGEVSQVPQMLAAVGVERPAAPDPDAFRKQAAAEFGNYTPEQIEDPNFIYTNKMVDPQKQQIQAAYRQRVQQVTTTGMSAWKQEDQQYMQGVLALLSQVGQEHRADRRQEASDKRHISAQAASEGRQRTAADEATKRQALAAWQQEMRAIAKAKADDPSGMTEKRNPGAFAARIAAANEQYFNTTGQRAPGAETGGARGADAGGAPVAWPGMEDAPGGPPNRAGAAASPAATAPTPTPAPGGKKLAASPPNAPITPQDEARFSQIRAKMRQQGIQDHTELPPDEQRFVEDYARRKRGL